MPAYLTAAAVLLLGLASGCSRDPLGRLAISGTVKVDGAPLPKGNISFQPIEGQATQGGSVVEAGRYAVPREGGLVPGKYRVSINAPVPGTGGKPDETTLPGDPPAPPKELIPPQWNTASNETIEVKKQGPFVFDFAISTKGGSAKAKP
jgi:hypothetical protein